MQGVVGGEVKVSTHASTWFCCDQAWQAAQLAAVAINLCTVAHYGTLWAGK